MGLYDLIIYDYHLQSLVDRLLVSFHPKDSADNIDIILIQYNGFLDHSTHIRYPP